MYGFITTAHATKSKNVKVHSFLGSHKGKNWRSKMDPQN